MALSRFRQALRFNKQHEDEGSESPSLPLESKEREDARENPMEIEEIIAGMDKVYTDNEQLDASLYVLKRLPEELSSVHIVEQVEKLRRELDAVSKKLSDLVLENHTSYVQELQRVTEIQNSLQMANMICISGRRQLAQARAGVTSGGLGVLNKHRQRLKIQKVLRCLRTIKTLQRTDVRTREMLDEEDYPGAIQLCLECQKAIKDFKKYTCISDLNAKLQDTQVEIEEQLDKVLGSSCVSFDAHRYERVQTAYRLLGKTHIAMDQILMHYTQTIHNRSFAVVLQYAERCQHDKTTQLNRLQYRELCKKMDQKYFVPCLIELCKSLWEVMLCYWRMLSWHERQDKDSRENPAQASGPEAAYNRDYMQKRLRRGNNKIWQDIKQRVKPYVLGTEMSAFQFDNFIMALNIITKLIDVGEELCGDKSEDLQESIRVQSSKYFRNYHRLRMDELRMFLENEMWDICPVRPSFTIYSLKEFSFLQSSSFVQSPVSGRAKSVEEGGYFSRFLHQGNPFDDENEEVEFAEESLAAGDDVSGQETRRRTPDEEDYDDDDEPEELKRDYVDEGENLPSRIGRKPPRPPSSTGQMEGPLVTNTTLTVIRLFGKYMRMMDVLKPIAYDVMYCLSQLFDYYLFAVHSFFASDMSDNSALSLSSKMRNTLKRINENLILHVDSAGVPISPTGDEIRVPRPVISPMIPLTDTASLFGLCRRVTAVESLVFLSSQFESLQSQLEVLIPHSRRAFLSQFYSQTVSIAAELRKVVYWGVGDKVIDTAKLLQQMVQVRWDIKEIMSQHSHYVDYILTECQVLKRRIDEWNLITHMPDTAINMLWDFVIRSINRTFVEGFASAKKCSHEGRALMQLDFQQFLIQIEKLTKIRPVPEREFVEVYIKAYYIKSEADIEQWIRDHRNYTAKQLTSLVHCGGAHINKKSQKRLINIIDDLDRSRRTN